MEEKAKVTATPTIAEMCGIKYKEVDGLYYPILGESEPESYASLGKYGHRYLRAGGVIPGITPGKSTSDYLNNILNYIVFVGAVGLLIIALIPIMCTGFFNASVSFGGTSVIIIVGVVLETLKQIESQMVNRYYKGFLSE